MPYYAAKEAGYCSFVAVKNLHFVERSNWDSQTLENIVRPLSAYSIFIG